MDEDDFEKRASPLFERFRAKCSELNLVNSEMSAANTEQKRLHEIYRKAYDEYLEFSNMTGQGIGYQLTETRSEIQALQAELLDLLCEHMISPRHPHERGDKLAP